jgi:hypothetical protein
MADRRSEVTPEVIRTNLERIRREEGRHKALTPGQPTPPERLSAGKVLVAIPADQAPRDKIGLLRLRPTRISPSSFASAKWGTGKICGKCPLVNCSCYQNPPTHWIEIPDELA